MGESGEFAILGKVLKKIKAANKTTHRTWWHLLNVLIANHSIIRVTILSKVWIVFHSNFGYRNRIMTLLSLSQNVSNILRTIAVYYANCFESKINNDRVLLCLQFNILITLFKGAAELCKDNNFLLINSCGIDRGLLTHHSLHSTTISTKFDLHKKLSCYFLWIMWAHNKIYSVRISTDYTFSNYFDGISNDKVTTNYVAQILKPKWNFRLQK